jgi:hypothetical protein
MLHRRSGGASSFLELGLLLAAPFFFRGLLSDGKVSENQ